MRMFITTVHVHRGSGRFSAPNKLENHSSEGIERRRRKSEGEERMKREKSYGFISVSLRFLAERKAA